MSVVDRHIVVTDGGTGMGRALALGFAHAGARVTIMGRREAFLREVARQHREIGYVLCDVTDRASVQAAFRQARGLNGAVTVAVANAGAAESLPFSRITSDHLQAMLAVNLGGVVNTWQATLDGMKTEGWGRCIAIASTAGLKGYTYASAYAAAKHAVVGLTRSLALELGQSGVTVNAVCPGFVDTAMPEQSIENFIAKTGMSVEDARASLISANPQNRFIQPDEVAGAALWLCSDAAASVNGHALALSGGEI